ncbi:MAG: RlmE family RNA methyltransferase [Bauldia sp.]
MAEQRGRGDRALRVRVKTAGKRTPSSTRWLERQLNDPYVARARREGYRSRSAFKLIEIDDRYHLLAPGRRVLDLGAAPGGWCQVAVARVKSTAAKPLVVGVDILPMEPVPGLTVLTLDVLAEGAEEAIRSALGGNADLVLSDMAAATTGHRPTDHLRTVNLFEAAADIARRFLVPGGTFLAKVFQGGTEGPLLAALKRDFASVRHVKPKASRQESVELYVLAQGYRPTSPSG